MAGRKALCVEALSATKAASDARREAEGGYFGRVVFRQRLQMESGGRVPLSMASRNWR